MPSDLALSAYGFVVTQLEQIRVPVVLCQFGRSDQVLHVNAGFQQQTGYTQAALAEAGGLCALDQHHGLDVGTTVLNNIISRDQCTVTCHRHTCADGRVINNILYSRGLKVSPDLRTSLTIHRIYQGFLPGEAMHHSSTDALNNPALTENHRTVLRSVKMGGEAVYLRLVASLRYHANMSQWYEDAEGPLTERQDPSHSSSTSSTWSGPEPVIDQPYSA